MWAWVWVWAWTWACACVGIYMGMGSVNQAKYHSKSESATQYRSMGVGMGVGMGMGMGVGMHIDGHGHGHGHGEFHFSLIKPRFGSRPASPRNGAKFSCLALTLAFRFFRLHTMWRNPIHYEANKKVLLALLFGLTLVLMCWAYLDDATTPSLAQVCLHFACFGARHFVVVEWQTALYFAIDVSHGYRGLGHG